MTVLRVNTIAGVGTTTFGPTLEGNLEFNSQNYIVLPKGSSTQEGVLRTTADVVGTGGTYYDNLVLAMPFNQANGFRDVSSRNRNPAAYGNVAISTAQSKYYGSSAYFDGSGDYLSIGDNEDFNLGSKNWTLESWVYYSGSNDRVYLYFQGDMTSNDNRFMMFYGGSTWTIYAIEGGSTKFNVSFSDTLTPNTWFHIALVRESQTFYIFKNGSLLGSNTDADAVPNLSTPIYIGSARDDSTQKYFQGYLQDLRIYKGLAKYTANFTPPDRIAEIGVGFKAGQLRYNTDSNKVELYDGNQWTEVQASRPDLNGGARGVFGAGYVAPSSLNVIDYINISSTGNAQDFGDLTGNRSFNGSCSSSTRGLFAGSFPALNIIDYVTISSTGNAFYFGDITQPSESISGCSNSTRGLFAGGIVSVPTTISTNTISYITMSSTGNSVDFGDLLNPVRNVGSCASSTRGIFSGGRIFVSTTTINNIDFVTISSTGNAQDFGDLILPKYESAGCSNPIRGIFGGGRTTGDVLISNIDYITISSLGNSVNFGNLSIARTLTGSCASSTRGTWGGGISPANTNTIEYVSILTQGNAIDFGDLTVARQGVSACSNAHGGL